jgi:hypothetical protein
MYVSILTNRLDYPEKQRSSMAVECNTEFSFDYFIDSHGNEKVDYSSLCLRGDKIDSHNLEKRFEIQMSPAELTSLVEFAINNHLVTLHAEANYRDL